eukprot:TRINITY_DN3812_c0_g2_i1.p1 TRINITY_DN3812_c0_g2~~TRINITY_DN3812_c0_g2_i1.p1  ORF type:complete len:687 (-),score=62.93 TRINITY_DN3812_c0_g2_i1:76-2136(-)
MVPSSCCGESSGMHSEETSATSPIMKPNSCVDSVTTTAETIADTNLELDECSNNLDVQRKAFKDVGTHDKVGNENAMAEIDRECDRNLGTTNPGSVALVAPEMTSVKAEAETLAVDERGTKKKVLFNASHSDYESVITAAESRGWRIVKSEEKFANCNIHWIDDATIGDWLRRVEPWMRINHFPGMNQALARKTRLARNMCRMQRMFPTEYNFIPPTWVLPDDLGSLEKRFDETGESKTIYIVKPDHLCQGKGIFLTCEVERMRKVAAECRERDLTVVVQRYLAKPMLIEGLKFDLRLYFLVCGVFVDGEFELRCFLFRDGLVRLCTKPYVPPTPETFDQKCMHLTNYAVNKNSKDFQQNTDADNDGSGSKRSLRWFLNQVEAEHGEKERRKLWLKLMGLCTKMVLTVQPTLEAEYVGTFPKDLSRGQMGCRCFEILGVDVMLDERRKPYLIEVNHLPSFTCDSPLDEDIKSRLIEQTLDLTCANVSAKDKKYYEQFVRERRGLPSSPRCADALVAASSSHGDIADNASMLDLPSYKDFERAYPPPETAAKLTGQCATILNRVRQVFKPVQVARRRGETREPEGPLAQKPAACRPPRPPEDPAAARPPPSQCAAAAGMTSKQRSRSAPGPPRCALPPIARSRSPHSSRGRSVEREASAAPCQRSVRAVAPPRTFLALGSAQLGFAP